MPSVTITIDAEVHRRLKKLKRRGESFSDVLRREVCEPCDTGREILESLERDYPPKRKLRHAA